MAKKKNDLAIQVLDFLKTKSNDPSEVCTALSQALLYSASAAVKMSENEQETLNYTLSMFDKMREMLILISK